MLRASARERIGDRRRADHDEDARLNEGLDVHVHCSFRCARHRHHDMLGGRLDRVARVRPNRHQAAVPCPQRLERLLPDDLARARAADEPFHAAVGEHDRAVAEVRRDRRAAGHDRRHGERLPFTLQRRDPLEEVDHRIHAHRQPYRLDAERLRTADSERRSSNRAARAFSGSSRPASCP